MPETIVGFEDASVRVGGKPLKAAPVVADGIAIVQNVEGELTAFRLQ